MSEFASWDSFYVIVGSAAGALIGLQFVVMTLIAARPRPPAQEAGAAFATPTIVHFSTVLLLSALLRAPWPTTDIAEGVIGGLGLCGVAYTAAVGRRIRRQMHTGHSSRTGYAILRCRWWPTRASGFPRWL